MARVISGLKEIKSRDVAFLFFDPPQFAVGDKYDESHEDVLMAVPIEGSRIISGGRLLITGKSVLLNAVGGSSLGIRLSEYPIEPAVSYLKSLPDASEKEISAVPQVQ